MSQTVVDIPGLPDGVEVRRSTRRRRSVTAYREGGRTIVVVPHRMSRADIRPFVEDLLGRLAEREKRGRRTDSQLQSRAAYLSDRYLDGRAVPSSVRWVTNQRRRWGSCTPSDRTIRLSDRLAPMPEYVVDYVLLHELVHLLVPGHGPDFEAHLRGYPRLLEARAFLSGVDHAQGHGLDPGDDDVDDPVEDAALEAAAATASGGGDPDASTHAPPADAGVTRRPVEVTDRVRGSASGRPRHDPGEGATPLW